MSDETTRARLRRILSDRLLNDALETADNGTGRVTNLSNEALRILLINALVDDWETQAAAHAETVTRLEQERDERHEKVTALTLELADAALKHSVTADRCLRAEAEVQRLTEALEREREQNNHRRGRRISIMELISGGPLDPLPYLADSIHDLNGLIENSPQADNNPQSPASQRRFWLEHSVHICEQVERHVARLNIEAEEMRAQLLRLAAPVPERKE